MKPSSTFSNFIPNEKMIFYMQFDIGKPSLILFKNYLNDKKLQSNWKIANEVAIRIKLQINFIKLSVYLPSFSCQS